MKPKKAGRARPQEHVDLAQTIGATARAARIAANLTQADVAERIGLKCEVYGRLERGLMLPSVPTLRRLGVALAKSSDVFMGLAEEQSAEARALIDDGSSPELRRLLRNLRTMRPEQLKLFHTIAITFSKIGKQGAQELEGEESSQVVN